MPKSARESLNLLLRVYLKANKQTGYLKLGLAFAVQNEVDVKLLAQYQQQHPQLFFTHLLIEHIYCAYLLYVRYIVYDSESQKTKSDSYRRDTSIHCQHLGLTETDGGENWVLVLCLGRSCSGDPSKSYTYN